MARIGGRHRPADWNGLWPRPWSLAPWGVLIRETPANLQADLWIGVCLLLAYPLWREGKGSTLRPLLGSGLTLAGVFALLWALRYGILHAELTTFLCVQDPAGLLYRIRAILGGLMYHQVFGLIGLALAGLAVWRRSAAASLLAMVAGLTALVFYNAGTGAIAFVLAGLILGHRKLAASGR